MLVEDASTVPAIKLLYQTQWNLKLNEDLWMEKDIIKVMFFPLTTHHSYNSKFNQNLDFPQNQASAILHIAIQTKQQGI